MRSAHPIPYAAVPASATAAAAPSIPLRPARRCVMLRPEKRGARREGEDAVRQHERNNRISQAVPFWAWMTIVVVGLVVMIALPLMGR